ncbi:MAG: tetratricopeptide repeat protein, partial [Pseudomonadota bacterium]
PVSGPGPDTAQRAAPAAALAAAPPDVLTAAAPTFVAPSAETDAFVERGDEPGADALAAGFDENAPGADLDDAFAAATDPGADPSSDTGVDHPAADAASEQEDVFDDFDDPFADGADDDADGPASAVAAHADDAFDLDDDDAAGPTSESPASAGPAGDEEDDGDILSAVRRSVGERMDQPAEQVAGAAPGSELDAVLAELEGMGFRDSGGAALKRSAPRGFDPADFSDDDFGGDFGGDDASDTPAAAGFDDEEFDDPAETDDEAAGSGVAGQASAGDEEAASPFSLAELPTAEDDQPADKPTKRQLTPKQRAILAARIRRRRMAEAEAAVEEAPADDPAPAPASTFERDAFEDDEDEEPRRRSLASKLSGVLSGLSGRRSRDDDDVEDEDDDDDGVSADRDEASAGVVRPTARGASEADEADSDDADDDVSLYDDDLEDDDYLDDEDDAPMRRPVALALIGATIVTAGAAACLLRDTFLPSAPETQIAAPASAPVEVPAPGDAVGQAAAPAAALETVEPRDVYFDAVAALKSAATPTDDAAALDLLRRASALGHPPAQLQLGEMYRSGEGVAPDPVEARRLFQEAAAAGNILAMHRAGVMSAQGFGGPVDVAAAMTFFEQAASRGHVDSQYNLGALYHPSGEENADGVQDPERAYFWYSLAANAGDDQAAALAAGVGGAVSAEDRTRVDGEVASWEAIPADPKANEVEPAA